VLPDVVRVIEVCYRPAGDEEQWLGDLVEAARPALDQGFGVVGYLFDGSSASGLKLGPFVERGAAPEFCREAARMFSRMSPEIFRRTQLGPPINTMRGALERAGTPADEELVNGANEQVGQPGGDAIGVAAHDPTGSGCILSAPSPTLVKLTPGQRKLWSWLAAHIAAGHRLRRLASLPSPGADAFAGAEAILDDAGRVKDAAEPAQARTSREALREAVLTQVRSSGVLRRSDPEEAVAVWRALVAGRWSLVDHFDSDGRRFFIARRNDPRARELADLPLRERQVVSYACLGHSNKLIAYELGLSPSTVATNLARVEAKLGARTRADLIRRCRAPVLGLTSEEGEAGSGERAPSSPEGRLGS
jgi:DNA-binding NarL/FixJ family response regulator